MATAASATAPTEDRLAGRRRRMQGLVTKRGALQLLVGVLVVGVIPVVATIHILSGNALRNEHARADAALRVELQTALDELDRLGGAASTRADDLARTPALQRAYVHSDLAVIRRFAAESPHTLFFLDDNRVAGARPPAGLTESIALTVDGIRIGSVVATVPLNERLARRLARLAAHGPDDRLVFVRRQHVVGSGRRIKIAGRTVQLADERYRALLSPVDNARGVALVALRPEAAISAAVRPYRQRLLYAGAGSFALLVLVILLLGGPILRMLGDFSRVASQAATDGLTGLGNRRAFDEELALEWRRSQRIGTSVALILADLDDFKSVNDEYGHAAGDLVLKRFAQILETGARQTDFPARYGGEEFAIIVPEADLAGGGRVARRLLNDLRKAETELPDGRTLKATASFGVAVSDRFERAEDLVAAADEALYEAKRAGKNRVVTAKAPRRAKPPAEATA
jgi:diguanylate cyclase (GGDEF)-like protein